VAAEEKHVSEVNLGENRPSIQWRCQPKNFGGPKCWIVGK